MLSLSEIAVTGNSGTVQVSGIVVQQPPAFDLALPLRLETTAGPIEQSLPLQGIDAPFRLTASQPPRRLLVDPDADIFRRLAPEELPATVNSLRGATRLLVVVARHATPAVRQAAHDLVTGFGQQAEWVEESALSMEGAARHDLLLVGWPERPELRPDLPDQLQVVPGRFRLEGQEFADPRDVLFAAFSQSADSDRQTGLFLPLGDDGAAIAARKIPHYGKYSYLAFIAGRNRVKGTWAVTHSPLIYSWDQAGSPHP